MQGGVGRELKRGCPLIAWALSGRCFSPEGPRLWTTIWETWRRYAKDRDALLHPEGEAKTDTLASHASVPLGPRSLFTCEWLSSVDYDYPPHLLLSPLAPAFLLSGVCDPKNTIEKSFRVRWWVERKEKMDPGISGSFGWYHVLYLFLWPEEHNREVLVRENEVS